MSPSWPWTKASKTIQNALGDRTENTLFIFTSDNGLMSGSHRMTGKAVPHAAATEVPLILLDGHVRSRRC